MERGNPASRFTLLCTILSALALSTHPTDARRLRRPTSGRFGIDDIDNSPPDLASDAELLRALDFLDRYERAKNRERTEDQEPLFPEEYPPYRVQDLNEIAQMQDAPTKWEAGDAEDDLDMEDMFPPRAEDLDTNEVAFARAVLGSFRDYEGEKEKKLFEKILGDVIAERLLEEDEEENIERLLEERVEEKEGIEDLAAIFEPSSDVSSSEVETGVFDPEDIVSLLAGDSSSGPEEDVDDIMGGQSQSSVDEGEEAIDEDSYMLSEGGLEALDEAEKILQEGFDEDGDSESLPDFDDTSDLTSFIQEGLESEASEEGDSSEGRKKDVLRDVIYRIVEDTLRKKLGESMDGGQSAESESYTRSSIPDEGSSAEKEQSIEEDDELLDELVEDILDEVDKLSSKILEKIKGGQEGEDYSAVESDESEGGEEKDDTSSSDGFFNDQPLDELSNSIPEEVVGEILGEEDVDRGAEVETASMVNEDEESMTDEELMNAIAEIVPVAQEKLCPVLEYILDDCSVIDGLRGLGSGGYRQAFGRPCNRHQLCYTCSRSYGIPTNLCDEIYKVELLTLCNGDAECKQRAKYFWLAATNDRTPPDFPLSVCSDRCVLDYLLSD